jgi:undecaprenyl-diphosphatase
MNFFDQMILSFFNQYARHSKTFDLIAAGFREIDFLKGGVLCLILCYLWFREDAKQASIRLSLVSTLIACFISVTIGRILALTLPFRPRPVLGTHLDFVSPYYMDKSWFENVSAFPSDHAALYSALAVGLYFAVKKVGLWAIFYACIFIFLPRIYEGMHHPTDILAGALVGILSVYFTHTAWFKRQVSAKLLNYSYQSAGVFYTVFFVITFQISALFTGFRHVARLMLDIFNNFSI